MTRPIGSDADVVARQAAALHQLGVAVGAVLLHLDEALAAAPGAWGADEPGRRFAQGYLPAQDSVRDALAGVAARLTSLGDGLSRVGALLGTVDGGLAGQWHRVGGEPGSAG